MGQAPIQKRKEKQIMKRLIVALGAAVFALGVHAAAVDWHFSMVAMDVNYEDLAGTVTLYFNDTLLGSATMEYGEASGDFVIDDAGGTIKAVAEVTNFSDGAGVLEYSYIVSALPLPGYPDMNSSLAAINASLEDGITMGATIDTYATVADNGYTPVGPIPPVIPEPTTGLLVLLGVAGLALRRRRA